ncbi:hypothetical protein OOK39_36235 [Streptomyces sp. NBC_00264]|uniref:hypothetical protein n=1 Tax=unclassified Streptomyces TaxID=2593676 RepID=UPI000F5BA058|nr:MULTISPECIES: hypothetical protein [unclassified Streptomyces]WSG54888.1 hypothetical protein OHA38_36525 [Streptomyces sp. NBC_01732]WSX05603.1 hypothetical protein OG355_36965 [Streptomyces sp. NBC_00987]MCX4392145.1 hypothetical protein [Streptomyces sp. NBC_01767]MCX5104276.1 hypothetical protein [Streptomyces sp. NBC_00439]MCX5164675.1 hypothetical protein [Streptomyces sp. NBC_00305]
MRRTLSAVVTGLVVITGAAACSSSSGSSGASHSSSSSTATPPKEVNPAGDIPDNQVYVAWSPSGGGYTVKVPEGWARQQVGRATVFSDKFNSVRIDPSAVNKAPTVRSVRSVDLPAIRRSAKNVVAGDVSTVKRAGGTAVLATYRADSAPDQVTGKSVRQDVQRYVFWRNGSQVVLTLSGAVGADNVDPWHIVTDSFRWA